MNFEKFGNAVGKLTVVFIAWYVMLWICEKKLEEQKIVSKEVAPNAQLGRRLSSVWR